MVIVNMSTARAKITKRQRRMRRAAQRRLQKQRKAELREDRAVQAAREARQRAIDRWNAEEDRLYRLRGEQPRKSSHASKPDSDKQAHLSRGVKFAHNVMVTEIPVRDKDKLPKPVTSPIGVSICGTDESDHDIILSLSKPSNPVPFAQLSEATFPDNDNDPDFTPDEPLTVNMRTTPIQRPRRRIVAKRLDVPLDQIIPAKRSSKSKQNSPPKRPRPETPQPSELSVTANGVEQDADLHDKASLERDSSPSKTRKSSKRKSLSDTSSPPDRPKSKRRRVQGTDNDSPAAKKRKAADNEGHIIETVNANGVDHSMVELEGGEKGTKPDKEGQQCTETPLEPKHTDRVLLISSTKSAERKKRTSKQSSSPKKKSKKGDKSSASTAIRDSPRKKPKSNAEHAAIPDSDQRDKPSESEDDQDLDNMFGDLVRKKAASRAIHEKKAHLEKQSQNGDDSDSVSPKRAKPKPKKGPSRYTQDGLRIVTYEEIAADQPSGLDGECPFDCSCCF